MKRQPKIQPCICCGTGQMINGRCNSCGSTSKNGHTTINLDRCLVVIAPPGRAEIANLLDRIESRGNPISQDIFR